MDQEIFKKFSENLKKVLVTAEKIAEDQTKIVDTEHLLLALLSVKESLASEIMTNFRITAERIKLVSVLIGKDKKDPGGKGISNPAKKSIQDAVSIASRFKHSTVDTEHLLLALLYDKNFNSFIIFQRIGVVPEDVIKQIEIIFNNEKNFSEEGVGGREIEFPQGLVGLSDNEEIDTLGPIGPMLGPRETMSKTKKESILEIFTTNVTAQAAQGRLDPVIGRENETLRLIHILSRRTKNNPILVGEPGVGKTSIVEGLALRIITGRVPGQLAGKEILSLDMGALIAGTMYRGQFESRIKKIVAEIKKKGNIILFIDEIHTVVGAGSTEGSIDAANLLKPMLARGEFRLIGSTTFDEYKKYIEKDAAFERRLAPVKISEPSEEESIKILDGIKEKYGQHHNVTYTKEAIVSAVHLSKRYINDRFLPDKAIDLLDEAAASKTSSISKNTIRLIRLKSDLRKILRQKDELIMAEKYREATLLREQEIKIENEIDKVKANSKDQAKTVINEMDIAELLSRWTGIPINNLSSVEKKRFLNLSIRIKKRIIGQDEAIIEVTRAIKRARVGIGNPNRPMGSFIFLGPTGVGKSELAKVLAKEILGTEKSLIKIDMSEFMERHNVSRLIGAPAGYIGYEEGGKLTEIVRKNPYAVILLDEVEKAHPEVFNILLQVMEDGELTDAKGRKIDFKNTILIMTSNLGTDELTHGASIGFNKANNLDDEYKKLEEKVLDSVEKHFKPEFINRLDKIVVFRPLSRQSIRKIVDIQIDDLSERLAQKGLCLNISAKAKDFIADKGYDPKFGARPVRKVISEYIEAPLSDQILRETINENIKFDLVKDKIALK